MTGQEFKDSLKNPKNIYCLVSTDSKIIDLYIKRFQAAINADKLSYGQINPLGKLFGYTTLNILYMPKLDEEIFKRPEYIFIHTDSIDKRSAIYKKYQNQIIEVANDYTNYIMKHSNFNEAEAKHFAKINNNDLGLIDNNLLLYNESNNEYTRFTDYSNDVYGWVNAFIKKEKLPNITEPAISVMALLATNCNNILSLKHNDTKDLNPYAIKYIRELANYITEQELIDIIKECFNLDCQIKRDLIDSKYALPVLIARRYHTNVTN